MVASPQQNYITTEEYLELELQADVKHEYIDGYAYAIAGASDAHVTVSGNLFALLRNHVRGFGCRGFMSDMKARIEQLNRYYYPDVMVTCVSEACPKDMERDKENTTEKKFLA